MCVASKLCRNNSHLPQRCLWHSWTTSLGSCVQAKPHQPAESSTHICSMLLPTKPSNIICHVAFNRNGVLYERSTLPLISINHGSLHVWASQSRPYMQELPSDPVCWEQENGKYFIIRSIQTWWSENCSEVVGSGLFEHKCSLTIVAWNNLMLLCGIVFIFV